MQGYVDLGALRGSEKERQLPSRASSCSRILRLQYLFDLDRDAAPT